MTATADAEQILKRVVRVSKLAVSLEQHLLKDQADAIAARTGEGGSGGGISDPTPGMASLLAPFADYARRTYAALRSVDNALDHAEREYSQILGQSVREPGPAEPKCPGWNDELRERLGGCGKQLETYRANGVDHVRSSWLCVGCRKAKERDERKRAADEEDAA
jgi:hypothetical protein